MKTAKEFRIDKFRNEKPFYSDKSIEYLMVEFAKEAIKADRKNVAKFAKSSGICFADKNSIINAPNIKLL